MSIVFNNYAIGLLCNERKTGLTFQTAELHCSLIIHNDLSAEEDDGGGGEEARACYTSF